MSIDSAICKYSSDSGWESDEILFADVAINSKQWFGCAGEHMFAAELLHPHILKRQNLINELMERRESAMIQPSLTGIYFFHCAIAVENSMKGVITSKYGSAINEDMKIKARIPKILLGHDLVVLAKRANYEIGLDEEYILSFLTRYGIWSGKYPLPIQNEHNSPTQKLSDDNHYFVGGYNPTIVPSFLNFCIQVYNWARSEVNKPILPTLHGKID